MKRPWIATLVGTLAGVFAAASTLLFIVLVILARAGIPMGPGEAAHLLWRAALSGGPPALLLTGGLAWTLRRGVDDGRPRGTTLVIGTLLGLLLGLVALLPAMWIHGEAADIPHLLDLSRENTRINLAVALAGGAVGGLACAWVVSRPGKKPA